MMILAYFDESGDDGYPKYSSNMFCLTALYFHYQYWREFYDFLVNCRREVKKSYKIPIKAEIHARNFLLNKGNLRYLALSDKERVELIDLYCMWIAYLGNLGLKVVNVVINKIAVQNRNQSNYEVLENAVTYSVQRIENDLNKLDPASRFLIITDPGRVGKMRKTTRKIQRYNYIPSKIHPGSSYRKEIVRLIEDPLQKESNESYFIQIADLISYIIHLHKMLELSIGNIPRRMPAEVNQAKIVSWMDMIKPALNLEASGSDPYGIVCYPK